MVTLILSRASGCHLDRAGQAYRCDTYFVHPAKPVIMASFVHRIEVHYTKDPRLKTRTDRIRSLSFPVDELHLVDVYTIETGVRDFSRDELERIGSQLINPVVQEFRVDEPTKPLFDYAIEVGFLPGSY